MQYKHNILPEVITIALKYRIFVHTLEDDQIYRFDDLTQEQKKKLEQKLIEQVENVPLRLAEEA